MMQPLIVCDIDGVLNYADEAWCSALNAVFGTMWDAATLTQYHPDLPPRQQEWIEAWFSNPFSYLNMAPDKAAIRALRQIKLSGLQVHVATDREMSCWSITELWLNRWGIQYDALSVGPGCKERLAAQHDPGHPMVMIDDNPAKLTLIPRPGVSLLMPRRPYTPADAGDVEGVTVFDSWDGLLVAMGVTHSLPLP